MRKFTLTAIAIKDEKVVGAFQLLSLRPQLDREVLQVALGKFIEKPYQKIVYGVESMIYLDPKPASENDYCNAVAEVIAFTVWRAAGALIHSKSLETEELKHGSNWLVALDDEPYLVKFVLEDQAQNYIVLHALPVLEPTVVIEDSGWLHNNVEPQSAAPQCTETRIGDKGVADTNGFARPKEVPEHNQAVGGLGHESPTLEAEEDTAETAVLPDTVHEPARISSVGVHMKMKNELEFSQEDPGPTEILAAFKKGYLVGATRPALDSGMFEKPLSEGFAEGLGEIHDQMLESRSASKALLTDEQEGFLAEAALRGQTAVAVPVEESSYISSGEVREDAKAVDLEYVDIASSDEYRKFCEEHKASEAEALAGTTTDNYTSPAQAVNSLTKEKVEDVPTNHTELSQPPLEI